MAEYNGPRQERAKNILDHRKLHLSAPCPGAEGKYSTLSWQLVASNPRMVVWTNDPNDTGESNGYGKITANLDPIVFVMFLKQFEEMINGECDKKAYIENKNYIFPGGKRSEHPIVVSTLYFGKDKDGMMWISLVAKNRPIIKFVIGANQFHHFCNGDGSPADKGVVSQLYAKAYIQILYGLMETLMCSLYVEPPKKEFNKGGGSYGGNKQSFVSDDIPF